MDKTNEEDLQEEEDTLCGNPHKHGDNSPENCTECMVIKLNI